MLEAELYYQPVYPRPHFRWRHTLLLHAEGDLVFDRLRDGLRLRLLEDHPRSRGDLPCGSPCRIQAAPPHAARELPAVELRHEPVHHPQ